MRKILCILFACCGPCCAITQVFSQPVPSDSLQVQQAFDQAIDYFSRSVGEVRLLYNGSQYLDYDRTVKGDPYFLSTGMVSGNLYYDGTLYRQVPLQYDIQHDQLVTLHFNQVYKVRLVEDKVSYFELEGHHFIRLRDRESNLPAGFYEQLYNGPTRLLARRVKKVQEKTRAADMEINFTESSSYYLYREGTFRAVTSRNSLWRLLAPHKKELLQNLKNQHIKYRKQPEQALVESARLFDRLNH
ncbi:MAG TPA: hypothetical protein VG870_08685 [Chitinophagaceae bacterium]|nr:hypothetical protein [Chitinophagaceae bacterium]